MQARSLIFRPLPFLLFAALAPAMLVAQERSAARPFTARLEARYWTETGRPEFYQRSFRRSSNGSYSFTSETDHPLQASRTDAASGNDRPSFSYVYNHSQRLLILSEPLLQAVIATPVVDDEELNNIRSAYGDCSTIGEGGTPVLSQSTFLGHRVLEIEVERTERYLEKRWVAPDLGCFTLRTIVTIDGNLRERTEAVSVDASEPPGAMFEVPRGFALLTPAEMEARYRAAFRGKPLFGDQAHELERKHQRAVQIQ